MRRKQTGLKGESFAVDFLHANGYEVLARNYRFGRGEIDIIARQDNTLIFLEVKTRKNIAFGYPETFVSEPQKERIYAAAEAYVKAANWAGALRFDIIAIVWDGRQPVIDHFEDAF